MPTGIARLVAFLGGGLWRATLLAIGAQTKVGKTVLLATISHDLEHAAEPVPRLVVTLERSAAAFTRLKLTGGCG